MNNSIISAARGQLDQLLNDASSIGIIVGENQNLDTMGAALGLYLSLNSAGKSVQVVSKKEPIVELSSLFGIDRVSKSFSGTTKVLTISVPYREGEIEKVSYNIEGNKLNVNLFAEENGINFNENDVEYIRKGASPSLIIAIGVTDEAELAALVDPKSVKIITIDKSPLNSIQGDVTLVDPSFSSTSEIVAALIRELNLMGDPDVFQNLMDGITYATRNFTNPSTSALAFEAAGFLLSNGAKRKDAGQNDSRQQRQDNNRFPDSNQFLNRRPRNNRGQNPQNQPRQNQGNQNQQIARPSGNQPQNRQSFGGQNSQNQNPGPVSSNQSGQNPRNSAPVTVAEPVNDYQPPAAINEPAVQQFNAPQQNNIVDAAPIMDDSVAKIFQTIGFFQKSSKARKKARKTSY